MSFQRNTERKLKETSITTNNVSRYSWQWRKKLYRQALKQWEKLQTEMVIEECAELITAASNLIKHIQKIKRNETENKAEMMIMYLCDEIADVRIMMEQAGIVFDEELTDKMFREKLDRLEKRLKGENI